MRRFPSLVAFIATIISPAWLAPSAAREETKVVAPVAGEAAGQRMALYLSARRAMMMLRIGSHAPFPVVFDTGVSGTLLIDAKLADRLGLPDTGRMDAFDGQGVRIPGHRTHVVDASVSGVALPPVDGDVSPYDLPDEVGILSPNSFKGRLLWIDFARATVSLLERNGADLPSCPPFAYSHEFSPGTDPSETRPSAAVDVGGVRILAEIDTGSNSGLILPSSYISRLPLEGKPVAAGYGQSQVGREPAFKARIDADVVIAGVTLKHPDVLFMAAHKPNIGLGILKSFTIVLDPLGQRDWLLPAASPYTACGKDAPSVR